MLQEQTPEQGAGWCVGTFCIRRELPSKKLKAEQFETTFSRSVLA